jgi:hypothetical protein
MVDQSYEVAHAPERRVEGNLVEVLDDDIVLVAREILAIVPVGQKWIRLACPDAVDVDSVHVLALGSALPGAAEQVDLMTPRDNPAENFLEVKLGAAGLRVFDILPV